MNKEKNTNLLYRHEASPGQVELWQIVQNSPVTSRIPRPYLMWTFLPGCQLYYKKDKYTRIVSYQDWVAQTFFKFKCQLKLNWHLKFLEMYMELIYTYGLIES